ncbi:MAG: hypothetical protein JWQ74_886 [Marmoricola sp.]|nr:hypothetical protein [Marmoricola sp.]
MIGVRVVPWDLTEEALRLLHRTKADFASLPNAPRTKGRNGSPAASPRWGSYDFDQVRAQSEYLRVVSIVEAYVDSISEVMFDRRTVGMDIFYARLAGAVFDRSTLSWHGRKETFELHHGFKLQDCASWAVVDRAIEVRNSIAHGLGNLTRLQKTGKSDKAKVQMAKVRLREDRLIITSEARKHCFDASVEFIRSLDAKLPR